MGHRVPPECWLSFRPILSRFPPTDIEYFFGAQIHRFASLSSLCSPMILSPVSSIWVDELDVKEAVTRGRDPQSKRIGTMN